MEDSRDEFHTDSPPVFTDMAVVQTLCFFHSKSTSSRYHDTETYIKGESRKSLFRGLFFACGVRCICTPAQVMYHTLEVQDQTKKLFLG